MSRANGKTDNEIFGPDEVKRVLTKGRPKVNRDLARRLFEAEKYTTAQIAKQLRCGEVTVRRIRREFEADGTLAIEKNVRTSNLVEADFDDECRSAKGTSFLEFLATKRKNPKKVFNFCRKVWDKVWDKPSLVKVADDNDQLGDQICIKFLTVFNDPERSRDRKKLIRPLFKFLGRGDLNDKYLTMSQSRDPRSYERIPEINDPNFPILFQKCLDEIERIQPGYALAIKCKLVWQMRTGDRKAERGFAGIRCGTEGKSYAYFGSPENYQIHVLEKMGEEWDIGWMPSEVRNELYELWKTRPTGDPLWAMSKAKLLKAWGDVTERIIGRRLKLHHLRKVSITWLYVCGLHLEVAARLNVGWKDLSTVDRHYMDIGAMVKHSFRETYVKNIPAWFKDGLDEYIRRDAATLMKLLKVR